MQLKTYFASSVPAALELARKELGEDALLMDSRPARPESRALGRLEVTFAWEQKTAKAASEQPRRREVPEWEEIHPRVSGLATRGRTGIQEAPSCFEIKPGSSRTLAFIGPPGRGKTTTLVKVAIRFGLAQQIPVKIYTAGCHGVYGEEQMARFAAILGVPCFACDMFEGLNLALNGEHRRGLSLIDTPGISPGDTRELAELSRFLRARPEIENHLILRADARSADMSRVISRFQSCGISRLGFTGLDEAADLSAVAQAVAESRIPAMFAGTGPGIPDDLEFFETALAGGRFASRRMAAAAA
jgi:flagellar biosynthesis GTPase FlhF